MRVISIRRGNANEEERALLANMHVLRAKVFKGRLNWDVHVKRGQETDEYDRLDPTYLVLLSAGGQVIGCARLLPTVGPTMLGQTFPFLLGKAQTPRSKDIVESSRFCVDTGGTGVLSASGLREATYTLFAAIIEWSMANGYKQIVTVTDLRFERLLSRAKWPLMRLGDPHPLGNTVAVAGLLPVNEVSFARVRPSDYVSIASANPRAAA